jgi:hypothetical protein
MGQVSPGHQPGILLEPQFPLYLSNDRSVRTTFRSVALPGVSLCALHVDDGYCPVEEEQNT